jgi:uncharacterized protein
MVRASDLDQQALAAFCRTHGIRRLALFGSTSRGEDADSSDVDLLVEFEPGHSPGLIRLAAMELELRRLFGDREVELRTYEDLSRHFRHEIRAAAVPLHDAA